MEKLTDTANAEKTEKVFLNLTEPDRNSRCRIISEREGEMEREGEGGEGRRRGRGKRKSKRGKGRRKQKR